MRSIAFAGLAFVYLLAGCTGMRPGYETPTVTVKSVRAVPSAGALPEFEIDLQVINPNREALELAGVSYTVSLEGHDLIKGVGNDLPTIEGYGEGVISLRASANLFAGVGLIREMISTNKQTLSYSFEAKLDPGAFRPTIRVEDAGEVSLTGAGGTSSSPR